MRDLSLSIPTIFSKRSNRGSTTGVKNKNSGSIYKLNLSLVASGVILSLVYLFTVSGLGTKGYEIKKLDQQVKVLEAEQKSLQLQASDLQSINRIQAEIQSLNFVPATNVTYLKEADFALK